MWNKQRLKRNARVLLKANYLKVVVVGLILSFLRMFSLIYCDFFFYSKIFGYFCKTKYCVCYIINVTYIRN